MVQKVMTIKERGGLREEDEMSRKALEDYYYHIQTGHRYGFDFNQHWNSNFNILRRHVKKHNSRSGKVESAGNRRNPDQI